MADRVQFILDRMAPIFRDMEILGVFDKVMTLISIVVVLIHNPLKSEIRSIVRKRTDFEYLLRRRQQTCADFNKYLSYELNLEELMMVRCSQSSQSSSKEKKDLFRKLQSSFLRHICYVYERALRRFPGNMDFWNDYIYFLKTKGANNVLNTVFGRALSLHPKQENLWLQAAMFELETNCNTHAARVLLQRSLRINRPSEKLWVRYFQLEIWTALRVMERRGLLGLTNDTTDPSGFDSDMSSLESCLALALVVYRHAVTALPTLQFAQQMLESCPVASSTRALRSKIQDDIRIKHGISSSYWKLELKRQIALCLDDARAEDGADLQLSVVAISRCANICVDLYQEGVVACASLLTSPADFLSAVSNLLDIAVEVAGIAVAVNCSEDIETLSSTLDLLEEFVFTISDIRDCPNALKSDMIISGHWIQVAHKLWKLRCVVSKTKKDMMGRLKCDVSDVCVWLESKSFRWQEKRMPAAASVWKDVANMAWTSASHSACYQNSPAFTDTESWKTSELVAPCEAFQQLFRIILASSLDILAHEASTEEDNSTGSLLLRNMLTFAFMSIKDEYVPSGWVDVKLNIEHIMSSPNCRDDDRVGWAVWYVRLAAGEGLISFRLAVDFVECLQQRMPMAFAQVDMAKYYKNVLELERFHFQHVIQKSPSDYDHRLQEEASRIKSSIASASIKCRNDLGDSANALMQVIESVCWDLKA
jgi:hypothetical protein